MRQKRHNGNNHNSKLRILHTKLRKIPQPFQFSQRTLEYSLTFGISARALKYSLTFEISVGPRNQPWRGEEKNQKLNQTTSKNHEIKP
jgi:hypothetical protein